MSSWQYIDSPDQLADMVQACRRADMIAVDTEFTRVNTYYPIIGLVQIYNGESCFLIDPLAVGDMGSLAALLTDPKLLKVLHACSEDMEVLQCCLGCVPTPVFDTQIAAAALGVGYTMSYQNLVDHYLSTAILKDQARSDWSRRPLSRRQLDYAALDVMYLLSIYEQQMAALKSTPKLGWVEAECQQLGQHLPSLVPPEEYYTKIRGLAQLDRRQLHALRALCSWREVTARTRDIPRNRVLDKKVLINLVKTSPESLSELQTVANMRSGRLGKYGNDILALLQASREVSLAQCPALVQRANAPLDHALLKQLRQVVEDRARDLSASPQLLIGRRGLEALIRSRDAAGHYTLPVELDGWRQAAVGDVLLAALA